MGGAHPGQEVQGCLRKQTEQADKQRSSMTSASVSTARFLSRVPALIPSMVNCDMEVQAK